MPDCSSTNRPPDQPPDWSLSDTQRMLLALCDALYDGNWEDFKLDLNARRSGAAPIFETVPDSPDMGLTIDRHLRLIDEMSAWEQTHGPLPRDPATET